MRVFIIDTGDTGPELHGGLIGAEGSSDPDASEKQERVETVSRYALDGWAIAARTPRSDGSPRSQPRRHACPSST